MAAYYAFYLSPILPFEICDLIKKKILMESQEIIKFHYYRKCLIKVNLAKYFIENKRSEHSYNIKFMPNLIEILELCNRYLSNYDDERFWLKVCFKLSRGLTYEYYSERYPLVYIKKIDMLVQGIYSKYACMKVYSSYSI